MVTLSDRFDQIDAKRVVKPVHSAGAAQRRDEMDSRRKVGRQTQFEARRQGMANPKPAMRAAQAAVPRVQQAQAQRNYNSTARVQGRGSRGARTGPKPGVMPSRANNQSEGRGRPVPSGRGRGAPAGRGATGRGGPGGRGPSARGGGRTAASGGRAGRGGRGARGGRAGGRANGKEAFPKKTPEDLDEGLDEYWFKAGKGPDPKVASMDRSLDNYWNTKATDPAAGNDKTADGAGEAVAMLDATNAEDEVDPEL